MLWGRGWRPGYEASVRRIMAQLEKQRRAKTLFDFGIARIDKPAVCSTKVLADEESDSVKSSGFAPEAEQRGLSESSDSEGHSIAVAAGTCSSQCCKPDRDGPNRPTSHRILAATAQAGSGQSRSVNATWFSRYPCFTLCETRQILFCFYCVCAHCRQFLTFSKKRVEAFTSGFANWKKALEKFAKHEASDSHSDAVLKLQSAASVDISHVLDATCKQQQLLRRRMLLKQLTTLRYLVRQGLAIRGHDETEGNFFQLLKLRSTDDPEMEICLREGKYQSPDILNEMINSLPPEKNS